MRNPALRLGAALLGLAVWSAGVHAAEKPFDWQREYARVTETGDIVWTPRPFEFAARGSVRYIDYENGADANDGASKERPWKHHPWDAAAAGNAAAKGVDTYVFKGGVIYRGLLEVKEQGKPDKPIRLTRDPSWGDGPAIIAGSERVTGWTRGADHPKIPQPDAVWKAMLDFAPRTLWMVGQDGKAVRIPLARHPNWKSQPEDHKAQWFRWTNEPHPFQRKDGFSGNDSKNLKGKDKDFVQDALIYSEFGWVMGTPYPTKVVNFDPASGAVRFAGWTGGGNASVIFRAMRYYLEDKPQYLDDPEGEFWFERKGRSGGTLYVRLPGGIDPGSVRLEAGKRSDLIVAADARHIEITGLDFRWTTQPWELDLAAWNFRTQPYTIRPDARPACIRVWGRGEGIRIANCTFEDVVTGIQMYAVGEGSPLRGITVEDCIFRNTDVGAAHFSAGAGWGYAYPVGVLDDVRLYRNYAANIGFRPTRFERGTTFSLESVFRAHIAGNVIERSAAQGINVVGGKSATRGDVPLVRVLIHQNKAWKTMQNSNDFGGIESWQHGPVYIFNNLSFDARGQRDGERTVNGRNPGFGHAYYLDGGFKNCLFNNIAWGLSNDPTSPLVNCAAFQEIHSYQNLFLNNTAYNFTVGSRRQAPHAGRNKFVGNVWQAMSERVFRHSDPAKTAADGNANHAGPQKDHFATDTNAYARNVFYDIAQLGVFEPSGRWLQTLEDFRAALKEQRSMVSDLGVMDAAAPLRDPARGDFRLNSGSAAVDNGAAAFVPWALHGVAAEWNFYPVGNDPARIIDESWFARDFMTNREEYHNRPTYPLTAVNVEAADYIQGPLENFAAGALKLDPAKKTYATIHHADLAKPFSAKLATRARHGQDPQEKEFTFTGEDLKNPAIHAGNFLIEVYFQADGDGLIIGKKRGTGYDLRLKGGRAVFSVAGAGGEIAELASKASLTDGRWHHLVAEADRAAKTLAVYVDGKLDASGPGIGRASLASEADLFVGGGPLGEHLAGALEFMRISHGTLADAKTSIEELHAWQFDGPALRDMRGVRPMGKGRDAGAIETE